jgi:hypothetical protein
MVMVPAAVAAGAVMYECTRPDGTMVFTDNPLQAPANCRMITAENLGPALLSPTSPQPQAQPQSPPPAGAKTAAQAGNGAEPTFETFQSEAEQLVTSYKDTRRRYNQASFAKDQLTAMRELAEIKSQKNALLSALQQSSLSSSEKQQIMATLAAIAN